MFGAAPASAPAYTPAALGAKLVDYWQSHLGVTLNGSNVSAWTGQANGVVLSQPTEVKQPAYDTINTINGHAVIAPAGAEGLTLPALGCAASPKACFVSVVRTTSTAAVQAIIMPNADITSANGISLNYSFSTANSLHAACNGDAGNYSFIRSTSAAAAGVWQRIVAQYDTTQVADLDQMSLRIDGSAVAESDSAGSATNGNLGNVAHSIFSQNNATTYGWAGRCACLVLLRDLPTVDELAALEAWLASEYPA